jgi:hypothetical protein
MPGDGFNGQPKETGMGACKRTSKYGDDGFVYRRDLLLLHNVAGEERHDEQHDRDEEGP